MEGYEASASEESDNSSFEGDYLVQADFDYPKNKYKPITPDSSIEKVCRFLFAEDLVSYISLEFHGLNYAAKFKRDPELLYYQFNETVRRAVHFIRWQINETNCISFGEVEDLSKSYAPFYELFVDAILNHYSKKGFEAGLFLYYCVYFAELASKCYRPDFNEILDFAVYAILDAFCMLNEERDELNTFAESILCASRYHRFYSKYKTSQNAQVEEVSGARDEICEEFCIKYSHENPIKKPRVALEELNNTTKFNKDEVKCNLTLAVNKINYVDLKDDGKGMVMNNDSTDLLDFDKIDLAESENISPLPQAQMLEEFVLELTSVITLEASWFLEIYSTHQSRMKTETQNNSNKEDESETTSESLSFRNTEIKSLDFNQEKLISQTLADGDVKITFDSESVLQENESKSREFCSLGYKNTKFSDTESESLEVISRNPEAENENKNVNTQLIESFTQLVDEKVDTNSNTGLDQSVVLLDDQDQQTKINLVIYKREGEYSEGNLVLKVDSLLFAEDLVKYISKEFYDISYTESKYKGNRDFVYNAFNESVKEVANFIRNEIDTANRLVFDILANIKENREDCYEKYGAAILSHYVQDGMNSDVFLYYCMHFSELAVKLYAFDNLEVLDFAICSVLDAFCFLKDDWVKFDATVEKILILLKQSSVNPDNHNQYDRVALNHTEHVSKFDKDCLSIIHNSIKEIESLRAKFGEQELLEKTVEKNYQDILKNANLIVVPKMLKISVTEQNKDQTIAEAESESETKNCMNTFDQNGAEYLRNLRLEVCSFISFEAAQLLKQILT